MESLLKLPKKLGTCSSFRTLWDVAWDDMQEFRYRTSERFERTLTAYIKSINPKATVDYNYHGNPPFSFEVASVH